MKKISGKRIMMWFIVLLGCIFVIVVAWYFLSFHQTFGPDGLSIDRVAVSETEIKINGYHHGLFEYSRVETSYDNGALYIKLIGGLPFPFVERPNSTESLLIENKYSDLDKVYLRKNDSGEGDRLIWSVETGEITNRSDDPLNPFVIEGKEQREQAIFTMAKSKDKLSFFQFRNLEWGMTFEEICVALGKKESDFELVLDEKKPEGFASIQKEYSIKLDVLGNTVQAFFALRSAPLSEYTGLVSVRFAYEDMTVEKYNAVLEKVKKNLAYQSIKYDEVKTYGKGFKIKSQSTYNDFSEEIKDKFNKYSVWLCDQQFKKGVELPFPKGIDYKEFNFFGQAMTGREELTRFSFSFEDEAPGIANMYISGDTYEYITEYCKAYDKLELE